MSCKSIWTLYGFSPAVALERRERGFLCCGDLGVGDCREPTGQLFRVGGGMFTGPTAEHDQVAQRVAAEPVGAVHAARTLPGREQPGHDRHRRVGIDLDAAHHVVTGRADLHRLLGDVDVGQLLELVVHRRQPLVDELRCAARRDVEEDAAVR